MLGMANAKTGELRHRNYWYTGKDIERRAELCHVLRKQHIRELVLARYVHWERPRVLRIIKGRKRWVLGATRYTVFKTPHKQAASSTVNFVNRSRNLPTIPSERHQEPSNTNHQGTVDDDFRKKLEMFKSETLSRCVDPRGEVAIALEIICERIVEGGIPVSSSRYLDKSLENFFANANDREALRHRLGRVPL
jgi:hypothetical protein